MAQWTYDEALRRLLAHEGGYTNDAADPGGPTNFGITIYDYRKYVKPDATAADVRAMRVEEAKAIYRAKYWAAQRCDELPAGVDYAVFDYGVNSGIGRSGKVLRRALKLSDSDWHVTDGVLRAARADPTTLIAAICDERLRFLQSLRTWPVFGKGWGRRVAEVETAALAMAAHAEHASSVPSPPLTPTAPHEVMAKGTVPVNTSAQRGSAGAIAAAGATAAQQAHANGLPSGQIALIVAFAFAAAIGAYVFWHWRQQQQQDKPA
jgi:lysozyme family protein